MKILFIDFTLPYLLKDSNYPAGGASNQLSIWLRGLQDTGCKIGVLSWLGAKKYVGREFNFELLETYNPKKGIKILKYFYLYIPTIRRVTQQFMPDVIIQASAGVHTGIMAYIAGRLGVPFVYRVASDMDTDQRIYRTRIPFHAKISYRYGLGRTAATLCQNQYQYEQLIQKYPKKQHYIIHNPFDSNQEIPPLCNKQEKKYIAWVGIFKYEKNLNLFYKIAKSLPNVNFKIAGTSSKHIDNTSRIALGKLKTLNNVEFVGFLKRKKILHFLNMAIALLSTSHLEGFSNVFLEAMAVGTPVISPIRIDPDNIVTNHQLGLTTEEDEELPFLIQRMINMSDKNYATMATRCKLYILKNHDPIIKSKELVSILSQITESFRF